MIALRKFELFDAAASLLYPPVCALCGGKTRAGEYLCEQCEAKAVAYRCAIFASNVPSPSKALLRPCSHAPTAPIAQFTLMQRWPHTAVAVSFARSFTILNTVVRFILRHLVARWLCAAFDDERLRGRQFDIIVPVPLHPTRQRERGFNQAGLLAGIAKRSGYRFRASEC